MTSLRIHKGKTWCPPDVRDEFCSILVAIEQASPGCHRLLFAEAESDLDSDTCGYDSHVVARWIFTEAFLRQLLEIIPYYLALCAKGVSDPPKVEYNDRVVRFAPRAMQ